MSKTLLLVAILLISAVYQPSHHYLMTSGMSMTPEVHSLITMVPFLTILLLLIPTKLPHKYASAKTNSANQEK